MLRHPVVSHSLRPQVLKPSGSSVHGIFCTRILEWVAISYSRGSSQPRDWTCVSCISCTGRRILHHCVTWEAQEVAGWMIKTKYYFNHPKICFPIPFIIILGFFLLIPHCLHKSVSHARDLNGTRTKYLQLLISYTAQLSFIAQCFSD